MITDTAPRPVFLRKSSGFVRGFNVWDVFVFNVLGYATGLSLATNPTILGGLYPNSDIRWVLIFGLVCSIFCGILYGMYSAMWPRSGGDYVYIGRTLHPAVGFVANWGFTWSQIYGIGVFSGWAIRDALSPAFTTFGTTIGSDECVRIGMLLAKPYAICVGGAVVLACAFLISVVKHLALRRMLNVLFFIAIASSILMVASFFTVSHQEFVEKFNAFMVNSTGHSNVYEEIIKLAQGQKLQIGAPTSIQDSFFALPIGFLIFFGFTYSVYIGGEVREPQKSQAVGIIAALVFGFVISWFGMGRDDEVVGRDFNNAVAVVKSLKDSPLPAGGSMIFFSGVLLKNPYLSAFMNFGSFLWFFLLPLVMTLVCVRNIFAWAFDRVVPEWYAGISSGNRAWHAATAIVIAALVFLVLDSLLGFPYINYIVLFSLCFAVTGVAGMLLPWRRQDLFAMAPPFAQRRFLGLPIISIAGFVTAAMFCVVLYSALTNSAFSGVQAGAIPRVVLLVCYGLGVLVWFRGSGGKGGGGRPDPHMLFQNLPPE